MLLSSRHNPFHKGFGMFRFVFSLLAAALLCGCTAEMPAARNAHILVVGDSMLASNREIDGSVANVIEATLGREVVDRSTPLASYFQALPITGGLGFRIPAQYRPGDWDVVVMNGGGNDLLLGCGCGPCTRMLDRLVAKDGRSGAIPEFVSRLRGDGAQVIYIGYLRNPGVQTAIKACGPAGNELDRRLAQMAKLDRGFHFLPMSGLVPMGDRSFHSADLIHPSPKASRAIGLQVAELIRRLTAGKD